MSTAEHQTAWPGYGGPRPLDGVRVIDVATFLAGPHGATLLAEFGAEVIKVELPGAGDSLRKLGAMAGDCSLWWRVEARNKKTITCDLRKPRGQDLLRRLVQVSDVLIENFRPGTLEGWGLGWEDLHRLNPRLIMLRISAYGQTGPNSRKPGFGRIAQAYSGFSYLAGFPDRPPVTPGTASVADYVSGIYGALGALLALRYRDQTGEGQYIDIGLYESIFRILEDVAAAYDKLGLVRQRQGTGTAVAAPHNHYQCADGEWIAIACTTDTMFQRLCRAIGCPELIQDPRFATNAQRVKNREDVDALVQEWLLHHPQDEARRLLDEAEVPNGPIHSIAGIFQDEHYRDRGDIITVKDLELGPLRMSAVVPRLSLTPGYVDHPGKEMGADNDAVYRTLLGLTEEEVARLREERVT